MNFKLPGDFLKITAVSDMLLFHRYLFLLIILIPSVNMGSSVSLYFELVKSM